MTQGAGKGLEEVRGGRVKGGRKGRSKTEEREGQKRAGKEGEMGKWREEGKKKDWKGSKRKGKKEERKEELVLAVGAQLIGCCPIHTERLPFGFLVRYFILLKCITTIPSCLKVLSQMHVEFCPTLFLLLHLLIGP